MKTGILGLLAGSFLFVSGLKDIDDNYTVEYWPERDSQLYFSADYDVPESKAYLRGIAGSALITLSIKHLLNQRNPKTDQEPTRKFREALQIFIGAGLMTAGFELKDLGPRYDQTVLFRGQHSDPAVDHQKEYYGFMVGVVGAAMTAYSTKVLWDGRKASLDIDRAFSSYVAPLKEPAFLPPATAAGAYSKPALRLKSAPLTFYVFAPNR